MKKLLLTTTCLIAGAVGLLAQGIITFDNNPFYFPDSVELGGAVDYKIYEAPGVPVAQASWRAQLFEGGVARGATLPFDLTFPGVLSTANDPSFGNRALGVAAGVQTTLIVSVLDGTGKVLGSSLPFTYTPPTGATPPPDAFYMANFRGFVVPEPSTVALGVLGLGALLLSRRRK
jgi:hypothetical protein